MGKKLIIAEKPSLSNTIQNALYYEQWEKYNGYSESENYICTHCFGNLFELYDFDDYFNREKTNWNLTEIPFIPNMYKYKIKNDNGVKKQLKIIEELTKRSDVDTIVNAGDADTEGTKLVNLVINYCLNKNKIKKDIKRLWFTDQSEPSIRKDIKNLKPNSNYNHYDNEATARERIDWIIGINFSRALSLISSSEKNKVMLPQGRVLGAIVKYIYDRYKERENFIPEKYFNIGLVFNNEKNMSVILKDAIFPEDEQIKALTILNELNKSNTFVSKVEKDKKKKYPLNLFSLTTLQNLLYKSHKLNNKAVLSCAQKLYEKGFITYPRTSTEYLATNSKGKVKEIIEVFKEDYKNIEFKDTKQIFDDNKIDSHEAIIPTTKIPILEELTKEERIVYKVIVNRFLSNFCTTECIVEYTTITIANSCNNLIAKIKGHKVLKNGFLEFERIIEDKYVPDLKEGEKIDCRYVINECMTQPPKNVSPTELNNFLESPLSKENDTVDEKYKKLLDGLEIGTVATRAIIIENALKYQYIEEKNGVYVITKKGKYFIEAARKLGLLMDVDQNVQIGRYLKAVFNKKITLEQCLDVIEKYVTNSVAKAKTIKIEEFIQEKEVIGECPICKKQILESAKAYYCEGLRSNNCTFSIQKKDRFMTSKGKLVTKSLVKSLLKNRITKVKGFKKKDGTGTYDAFVKLVKNGSFYNITFADKEDIPIEDYGKCLRCGKKILENSKSFYCSAYQDTAEKCSFTLWKDNKYLTEKGIKLNKKNYMDLLAGKKILIKNIKNNNGKGAYNAYLYIEDTGNRVNYKMDLLKAGGDNADK